MMMPSSRLVEDEAREELYIDLVERMRLCLRDHPDLGIPLQVLLKHVPHCWSPSYRINCKPIRMSFKYPSSSTFN